jgi:hypothetical protein
MENIFSGNKHLERFARTFFGLGYFGLVGLLPDIDHLLCSLTQKVPIWDTIGCKPFHPYLLSLVILWCFIGIALGIGWCGYVVLDTPEQPPSNSN